MKTKPSWLNVEPAVIRKVVEQIGGDGWTIYSPASFLEVGVPANLVKLHTRKHRSGATPKSRIVTSMGPVKSLEGVYGLEVTDKIVYDLGLNVRSFMGRGFQAGANLSAINAWLKTKGV